MLILCDNRTARKRWKNAWNPHYAFSRIVETWLDGTFNKFLAYGVFLPYPRWMEDEKYQLIAFKWGKWEVSSIDFSIGQKISPHTFLEGENWNFLVLPTCCAEFFMWNMSGITKRQLNQCEWFFLLITKW